MSSSAKRRADEIVPRVYLGPMEAALDRDIPSNKGKWFVLSVMDNAPQLKHIKQANISISDYPSSKISKWFDIGTRAIQHHLDQGYNVLIHCMMGISRSASMTIAYLMTMRGMSFTNAKELVETQRPRINPNPGFIKQLQIYGIYLDHTKRLPKNKKRH